jgi:hypothetical protein
MRRASNDSDSEDEDPELVGLRRYLVLGEEEPGIAWCPDWYPVFIAAQECGCTPWEMLKAPVWWKDKALIKRSAEAGARKILDQHR